MKLCSFLVVVSCLAFFSANAQKIKGSDTVLPLAQKEAEQYMTARSDARVTITGGGSGVGISALLEGTADIAMSSRKIKFDERVRFKEKGKKPVEKIIAYDALAVVVNPENAVSQLTRKQLEDIYTGKITNWKAVGGDDMPIVTYSRETSSGTYEFFKEHVLKNKNYVNSVLSMPATGAIVQSVHQTKGAIGYVGLAYLNKEVKALRVSYDDSTYVTPSLENARNKSYPVVRPLYFYYENGNAERVIPFIDYIYGEQGQATVRNLGYIPIQ